MAERKNIFKKIITGKFKKTGNFDRRKIKLLFPDHHLSHAASAFYPSSYSNSAIVTIDGVGEWSTASICSGSGNRIGVIKELRFPHSVGLLYSSFTYWLGFRVNSGEYKLMGLAPYGNPDSERVKAYIAKIKEELENIENTGRIILPRKLTIQEIEYISNKANENNIRLEAFGLSDPCQFNDEYCFSWHGGMQPSLCQSPLYLNKQFAPIITSNSWKKEIASRGINSLFQRQSNINRKVDELRKRYNQKHPEYSKQKEDSIDNLHLINRIGKCGICAIEKFKQFGIEAIKLPLRGHHITGNLELIKLTKQVINRKNADPDFCRQTYIPFRNIYDIFAQRRHDHLL